MREYVHWINNSDVSSTGGAWIEVIDPATEDVVGRVPLGTSDDTGAAIAAARDAFPAWAALDPDTRVDLLREVAARLRAAAPQMAITLTHETGRMQRRNQAYVAWSARLFEAYAELARADAGRVIPAADPASQINLAMKVPYGVIGCIVPFNYPITLLAWKLAPLLAAGNTAVIKPAPQTPLATLEMMKLAFDHLPAGVVNVVTGDREVGERLVTHPDVAMVAFTGSTQVGAAILAQAAPLLKKVQLELGGSDPAIICADADLETAVAGVAWGGFLNAGQVCTGVERVYVARPIYAEFTERLAAKARSLAVGSGFDPETEVTPMISARARERVHGLVQEAAALGGRIAAGGQMPEGRGFFYPPTVVADCIHQMRLMRDETFGPALGLMPFDSLDEAIHLANDSQLGLGASVFTQDAQAARRVFTQVQAGTVWINDVLVENQAAPFGGTKHSGFGRELGLEGLDAFRQSKHIHWDITGHKKSWWF